MTSCHTASRQGRAPSKKAETASGLVANLGRLHGLLFRPTSASAHSGFSARVYDGCGPDGVWLVRVDPVVSSESVVVVELDSVVVVEVSLEVVVE